MLSEGEDAEESKNAGIEGTDVKSEEGGGRIHKYFLHLCPNVG
jgi:hypothetical protein